MVILNNDNKKEQIIFSLHRDFYVIDQNSITLKVVLYSKTQRIVYIQDHQLVPNGNKLIFDCLALTDFNGFQYFDYILLYFHLK